MKKEEGPAEGADRRTFKKVKGLLIRKDSPEGAVLARIRSLLRAAPSPAGHSPLRPDQGEATSEQMQVADQPAAEEEEVQVKSEKDGARGEEAEVESGCRNAGDGGKDEDGDFVPSVKIKRYVGGDGSVLISILALQRASPSSDLFRILEEEELDIVFANQYAIGTTLSHTLQVRLPEDYDLEALKEKLGAWAGV